MVYACLLIGKLSHSFHNAKVKAPAGLLRLRISGLTEGNNTFTIWIYLLGNFSKQEESIHYRPK